MAFFLTVINPAFIIDINWITRLHTLYFVWCKKNHKKFAVIQHGTYVAGLITDIPHRIVKCQVFLVWSSYWKQLFEKYNPGKNFMCTVFGNPVFNSMDRTQFAYADNVGNRVLFAPSLMEGSRYDQGQLLIDKLIELGFTVTLKEHVYQSIRSKSFDCENTAAGNLISSLSDHKYDFIITDVSSSMSEILFTKNRAIFFSPPGFFDFYTKNVYSQYFNNLALQLDSLKNRQDLFDYFDMDAQESLLALFVEKGDNDFSLI
jgi:hypothetical protein